QQPESPHSGSHLERELVRLCDGLGSGQKLRGLLVGGCTNTFEAGRFEEMEQVSGFAEISGTVIDPRQDVRMEVTIRGQSGKGRGAGILLSAARRATSSHV